MRSAFYILVDREPVAADLATWSTWFRVDRNRRVARSDVLPGVSVSTVFLGIDMRPWGTGGPPILFETMVFGATEFAGEIRRWATWAEAEEGHRDMCEFLRRT